ncbi:GlcG/HbpS family heme-binding protein [Thiolapillus brandeum]|uniref:Heme-binding protein n=1 Tax=Thiolapillus brandeum TaxID=1076588 RepID=A0A7U6GHP6_9GAMM|nr:heme-binding protein [Thiolapillus brandeum]BAO43846.1 conserved hypothetical protein [Thiolapillus brandeum]
MDVSITQQILTWEAGQVICRTAVEKAEELGIRINVAVADKGGNLAAFLRMPEAFLHSIDIAIDKAYTAASFGFPTSDWEAIFTEEKMLEIGMPQRDRLVVFGGGIPIVIGDTTLGGIGVSGGSAEQDEICAQAGHAALEALAAS